jgi:hypothetical protein
MGDLQTMELLTTKDELKTPKKMEQWFTRFWGMDFAVLSFPGLFFLIFFSVWKPTLSPHWGLLGCRVRSLPEVPHRTRSPRHISAPNAGTAPTHSDQPGKLRRTTALDAHIGKWSFNNGFKGALMTNIVKYYYSIIVKYYFQPNPFEQFWTYPLMLQW